MEQKMRMNYLRKKQQCKNASHTKKPHMEVPLVILIPEYI